MTPITSDAELRTILQDAINANGVHIPLSQRSENGLEHFKATNGSLFTIMTLTSDFNCIKTQSNIRATAPLVEIDAPRDLYLDTPIDKDIEPTKEALITYFESTLLAFRTAYRK